MENKALIKLSKIIRIATIAPITNIVMLLLLKNKFESINSIIYIFTFIGIIPILSYLISIILKKDRDFERKLCFIFSFISYTISFILSLILKMDDITKYILSVYFLSVLFLTILNILKIKASGHAASIVGPSFTICYFLNYLLVIPCLIIYLAVLFSSLYIKRHKVSEFIIGSVVTLIASIISLFIFIL